VKAGGKLGSFFDPEDGGDVPLKCGLPFNGLRGVISQKTVLFAILKRQVPGRRCLLTF
jgi:hypothetical protein